MVHPLLITALPHMPPDIAGVANHRDQVLPVIDLRVRFNLEPKPEARGTKWILITLSNRVVGLIVDSVTEVFGAQQRHSSHADVGGNRDLRGISGVARHEGRLTFVLDTARFLDVVEALSASGAI